MSKLSNFLNTQDKYEIGFMNKNVIEYGAFNSDNLVKSIQNKIDPLSMGTEIIDSDLSHVVVVYYITDNDTQRNIFESSDFNKFQKEIIRLANEY